MDGGQTFKQQWWPLHFALAWVLRRDVAFAERATCSDFRPLLARDGWESEDEVDCAWRNLHQVLAAGTVPAIKVSLLCGNEESIAPEAFGSLTWDDLTEYDVTFAFVCSAAMHRCFPFDGDPAAVTSDHIEPPVQPDGPGYMTLSDTAYWIATEGGTKRIVATDDSVWRQAFAELLPRIQSGEVRVVGKRRGENISGVINPESFVSLAVDYPYVDTPMALLLCQEPHISCCGCGTAKLNQRSDELWGSDRRWPEWSHLEVRCSDIYRWWPFSQEREGDAAKEVVRKSLGKQPAVIKWLRAKYNGNEVPEPSLAPRKALKAQAIREVPSLGNNLDDATMKKAIDAYNDLIRGDPK